MRNLNCRAILLPIIFSLSLSAAPSVLETTASPDVMKKLARGKELEKFPKANLIFVEKRREIRYEMDGTYSDRNYFLIKILTEPAVSFFAAMPAYEYYSYRSEANVLFVRVIKPEGKVIEMPAGMITDLINPMYSQMNVTDSSMRLKQISFENLQVGDAVEYEVEEKCTRPVSSDFELKEGKYLQEDEPVLYTRIEINGPEEKPLNYLVKYAEKLGIQFNKMKKDGRITYLWEARDIPPFISEPGWNTRLHFSARLLASTIGSWQDISRTSYQINQSSTDENDSLRNLVAELTRDLKNDEEKILKILCYLRKNISYKGMTSVSAYKGKPATQTLADRFGVCRDVAVLMCAMLRAAGIESYPAATGYGRVFDQEVPHDIFQHMIVAVPDQKGGYRLYDPTIALYRNNLLPGYAGEAPLLVCKPQGEELQKIPPIPAKENAGTITAQSQIDENGRLTSTVNITSLGFYDTDLRNWRKRTKSEDYSQRWKQILTQWNSAAILTQWSTSDPEDLETPFSLSLRYEVPGYASMAGNSMSVKAPLSANHFERVLVDIVAKAKLAERKYPFILTTTIGVYLQESLLLPAGYVAKSLPENLSLKTTEVDFALQYLTSISTGGNKNSSIEFNKRFLIDSRQFSPESYFGLRKSLEANSNSAKGEIVLVKAAGS